MWLVVLESVLAATDLIAEPNYSASPANPSGPAPLGGHPRRIPSNKGFNCGLSPAWPAVNRTPDVVARRGVEPERLRRLSKHHGVGAV